MQSFTEYINKLMNNTIISIKTSIRGNYKFFYETNDVKIYV